MRNTSAIFFVTESEYSKLQKACPSDFPFTYAQFVARVEEGIKNMPEGFTVVKVEANIDEFLAWCAKSNVKPNNKARAHYAVEVAHKRSLS